MKKEISISGPSGTFIGTIKFECNTHIETIENFNTETHLVENRIISFHSIKSFIGNIPFKEITRIGSLELLEIEADCAETNLRHHLYLLANQERIGDFAKRMEKKGYSF